ncbi:MerR family transcriptional regulator [Irregularibacter muris]|uniref:MerR family transcriptional regulator n=1 Tax=Irregularibacter muris TaxID=1796619 RepID=A0AAE3L4B6_9FIRM|nr:MerR family transcriptional regulator [Irregularibacter muris]MCR1899823.1 MerR family transcriptional regulator [Irregularibacter muris]
MISSKKKDLFTVGELAKAMDITVRTLQYYDKEGLLKPSSTSEGGRRLYSKKDIVKLHQILSFKYLGFSLKEIKNMLFKLDSPEEVANILERQGELVQQQIHSLESALKSIKALHNEVLKIEQVDFDKYADIVMLLKSGNKKYWVWKLFDDTISNHIKEHFTTQPELGLEIADSYQHILDKGVKLKRENEPPNSAKSIALASEWWDMIMKFTGGDMSLIPKLMEFNNDKTHWDKEMAAKQQEIDDYIEQALSYYFAQQDISTPEMEE